MNAILANLVDPAWWFNIVFAIVLSGALPPALRWLVKQLREASRNRKASRMRKVRAMRRDSLLISYEMQKATAFFVVFVLISISALATLIASPFQKSPHIFNVVTFFVMLPVLWSELAWLLKDSFVKEVLRSRGKLKSAQK